MSESTPPDADQTTALEAARQETRAAFGNRALMYYHLFQVLSEELGEERAALLMKRAIYTRGLEVAEKYSAAGAAGNLDEIGRIFCSGSPCDGALFEPGVEVRGDTANS